VYDKINSTPYQARLFDRDRAAQNLLNHGVSLREIISFDLRLEWPLSWVGVAQ
jgi:hypothetical protein